MCVFHPQNLKYTNCLFYAKKIVTFSSTMHYYQVKKNNILFFFSFSLFLLTWWLPQQSDANSVQNLQLHDVCSRVCKSCVVRGLTSSDSVCFDKQLFCQWQWPFLCQNGEIRTKRMKIIADLEGNCAQLYLVGLKLEWKYFYVVVFFQCKNEKRKEQRQTLQGH